MSLSGLRSFLYRCAGSLRRRRLERDLDSEVRAHLEMLEARFRREGLSARDARFAARREFGGIARLKEAHRSERAVVWLEQVLGDFAYAFRALRRNPGFALTAIVSIALAVGANSAIFSYADGLLLRPLPVPDPSAVLTLRSQSPTLSSLPLIGSGQMSYPDFEDFRDRLQSFDGLVSYNDIGAGFAREAGSRPEVLGGYLVSGDFFQVLGVEPVIGRGFRPEEDRVPGQDPVIVLAHAFWSDAFGADPAAVGRSVWLNGVEFTVVGVAPEAFTGVEQFIRPDFFIPAMMGPAVYAAVPADTVGERLLTDRGFRIFRIKGRLKPGISFEAAHEEASSLAAALAASYPETNREVRAALHSEVGLRLLSYPYLGLLVSALFTVVVVNLLIACANVANLMLGRGRARAREIAVRLATGASRGKLIRLLLAESVLMASISGLLAWFLAAVAVGIFSTLPVGDDIYVSFRMDERVLWFTVLVSGASVLIFGLVPAFHSTRTDLVSALKVGASRGAGKLFVGRTALVIVQIAGSLVLLASAAQFRLLFDHALDGDPGFERQGRITMQFAPTSAGYGSEAARSFYEQLVDRAVKIPGVRSAALTSSLPLTWMNIGIDSVVPEGYALPPGTESVEVISYVVDRHYFETFGVPIRTGRGFRSSDGLDSPRVAVVNEAFAKEYLGADPLGRRFRLDDASGPLVEVVGVTPTGKNLSVIEPPIGVVHLPFSQNPRDHMTLIAATDGDPATVAGPLQSMVRATDPDVPVYRVFTMDEIFERNSVALLRMVGKIYDLAGVMGLVLALVGLYAVVSYQVAQRTREIGIRMALGARRIEVMRMFLERAAFMSLVGISIGVLISLAAGEAVKRALEATDLNLTVLALVVLFMLLTTFLAAAIPARRAARIDPHAALREE